jgi:hypothetical protein
VCRLLKMKEAKKEPLEMRRKDRIFQYITALLIP